MHVGDLRNISSNILGIRKIQTNASTFASTSAGHGNVTFKRPISTIKRKERERITLPVGKCYSQ